MTRTYQHEFVLPKRNFSKISSSLRSDMYVFFFAICIIFIQLDKTNEHECKMSENALVIFKKFDPFEILLSLRSGTLMPIVCLILKG